MVLIDAKFYKGHLLILISYVSKTLVFRAKLCILLKACFLPSDKPSNWFRSTLKSSSFSLSILGRESCHMDKNSVKLKAVEDWSKYSP